MRIQRRRSRLTFRTRRRRMGCGPLMIFFSLGVTVGVVGLYWLGIYLNARNGESPQSDMTAAREAFDAGELTAAVNLARRVWTQEPQNGTALLFLVRAMVYRSYEDYYREIDRTVALQLAEEATLRLADDQDVQAAYAFALQANDRPLDAWEVAKRVLDAHPQHNMAQVTLSLAYGGVGGFENALRHSEIAIDAHPQSFDAYRAKAISLGDLGRYHEALQVMAEAIELHPRLSILYFEQALYAMQIGNTGLATDAYFHVLAYDQENIKVRLRMCELSSLLGERDTALEYCQTVTRRAPRWITGWYRLGREYFLMGDFVAAQKSLNRCTALSAASNVPIDERELECWLLQGQAAEVLGDCTGLLNVYQEFQQMVSQAHLTQTWIYPPEGPTICLTNTPTS